MIYAEVCANPTMNLIDIPEFAKLAHENGALLMMDNTFTTALSIKPLTLGADIVISSMTKFMNGHSDAILGCMTASKEIIETVRPMRMLFGTPADPFPCWQIHTLSKLTIHHLTASHRELSLRNFGAMTKLSAV